MKSISANLNVMIKACEKASKILIRDFGELEKLQVSKKGPRDFVTNSDIKAEKIIIEELKKARPNYSIIIFSAFISELVTKSLGPFLDTCKFSNSPKSLIKIFDAFSHAFIITLRFADIEFINQIFLMYSRFLVSITTLSPGSIKGGT